MKKYLFLIVIPLLIGSCKENATEEPVIFSGISVYDEFGVLISEDTTDWQLLDRWQSVEKQLFDEQMPFCDTTGGGFSVFAYPNPCSEMLVLDFTQPGSHLISLRLVDQDFNVLYSKDTTVSNSWILNPEYLTFNGDMIRLYYKFSDENCEFRGHGDIRVIK
jgi:hypothetical protein